MGARLLAPPCAQHARAHHQYVAAAPAALTAMAAMIFRRFLIECVCVCVCVLRLV
jgi:hypothetical protein